MDMNIPVHLQQSLGEAAQFARNGNFQAAESILTNLLTQNSEKEIILLALLELYTEYQRPMEAIEILRSLLQLVPGSLAYCERLAKILAGLGQYGTAIKEYRNFIAGNPASANAWFNLALLYKKAKQYQQAISSYEEAINLGVSGQEEVYSNLGVLYSDMRDAEMAMKMYSRSLEIAPGYIPAMFNMAGLYEERGEKEQAEELYQAILEKNPRHYDSLSRLAYAKKISNEDEKLLSELEKAVEDAEELSIEKESVLFALGKAHDDLEQYDRAAEFYDMANRIGEHRNNPYVREELEQSFDQVIKVFSASSIEQRKTASTATPIFICGMFRSGSTLLEQLLSSHREITAGGELDNIQWLIQKKILPFPEQVLSLSSADLGSISDEYLDMLCEVFTDSTCVTDKQPDNYVLLGLIKILFPNCKIIYTRREMLDNCLSIYFQQLGAKLNYATDMQHIVHYYRQHERLVQHWQECFKENIFTVDYDRIVHEPETQLRAVVEFLELDWDPACLEPGTSDNLVKTASVWQVREDLHSRSIGRWMHYPSLFRDIEGVVVDTQA